MADDTFTISADTEQAQEQIDKIVEFLKQGVQYATSLGAELKAIAGFKAPMPVGGGGAPTRGTERSGDSTYRELATRHMRDEIKYFKTFTEYNKLFKPFSAEVASLTRGMIGIGSNLLKLVAGGALGGAAGFLGGVMPLARGAVEDRRAALQLGGANIGKMKAAGTAFGNILNVPDAVGKISAGQFDITSPAYTALKMMGFSDADIQGNDPSDLLIRATKVEQGRMKSYPNKQTGITMESARGATAIFGPDALKALGALPSGEFEDRRKQYQDIQKSLDLTQKEQQAIDRLVRHIDAAGEQIENVMVKNLATMAPYLTQFSDWIADFVVNRIPHEPGKTAEKVGEGTLKDIIIPFVKMNEKIDKWFGDLFGGAKQKTEEDFTAALKGFTEWWKNNFGLTPAGATVFGGGDFPGKVGSPSIGGAGGRVGYGRSGPNAGMTGVPASSAEVNAIIAEAQKTGKFPDTIAGHTAYIKMMAPKYGIDPQFAVDVAASEGLFSKRKSQGSYVDVDAQGNPYSFWDFQLNYKRGVGTFAAKEGIDPNRPEDWMKADEFALRWIKEHGMGDWRTDAAFRRYGGQVKHVPTEAPKLPDALKESSAPRKGGYRYHDPDKPIFDYPAPGEKVYGKPLSMNNNDVFQMNKDLRVHVSNPAGANIVVASGMLGSSLGNFGNA